MHSILSHVASQLDNQQIEPWQFIHNRRFPCEYNCLNRMFSWSHYSKQVAFIMIIRSSTNCLHLKTIIFGKWYDPFHGWNHCFEVRDLPSLFCITHVLKLVSKIRNWNPGAEQSDDIPSFMNNLRTVITQSSSSTNPELTSFDFRILVRSSLLDQTSES